MVHKVYKRRTMREALEWGAATWEMALGSNVKAEWVEALESVGAKAAAVPVLGEEEEWAAPLGWASVSVWVNSVPYMA
jgi:hypothetical protein